MGFIALRQTLALRLVVLTVLPVLIVLTVVGCGGKEEGGSAGAGGSAGTGGSAGAGGSATGSIRRVPAQHRTSGSTCADGRGPINPTAVDPMCPSEQSDTCDVLFSCAQDKDCAQGINGRCWGGNF